MQMGLLIDQSSCNLQGSWHCLLCVRLKSILLLLGIEICWKLSVHGMNVKTAAYCHVTQNPNFLITSALSSSSKLYSALSSKLYSEMESLNRDGSINSIDFKVIKALHGLPTASPSVSCTWNYSLSFKTPLPSTTFSNRKCITFLLLPQILNWAEGAMHR